ncbi:MAG TPA: tetratricopeptide repeat protein [Pyrinomonadaceae bacterium]|nr:tetratricopeptide repeat protein [Pyrinomonadaceae bacterium]
MKTALKVSLAVLFLLLIPPVAFAQKTPRTPEDFYNRGLDRQAQGDLDGALADFDKAIELNAADALAHVNRGLLRRERGEAEGALKDFTQAVLIDPRAATAYANRGVIYLQRGQDKLAEKDFAEAVRLDPALKASLEKYLDEMRKRGAKSR